MISLVYIRGSVMFKVVCTDKLRVVKKMCIRPKEDEVLENSNLFRK